MSERDLTRQVAELAAVFHWLRYHTWSSRHSPAGFPDETLVRGDRLLFVELKSATGKLTPAQGEWLEALAAVRRVETYLWRPDDLEDATRVLGGRS